MTPPYVLLEVFLSREPPSSASLAGRIGAHAGGFGPAVLVVDLALVAGQAAGVGEAADGFAAGLVADVGAVVFVHVFSVGWD